MPFVHKMYILTTKLKIIFLKVFNNIDEYAPGFSSSVIGYEVLSPPDLEKTFGLTGGVMHENCNFSLNFLTLVAIAEYFPRSSLTGPAVHNARGRRVWPLRPLHPSKKSVALRQWRPPWRRRDGLCRKNGCPSGDQNAQIRKL